MICTSIVAVYYNVLISYTLIYFVSSFTTQLPWDSCENYWNSDKCWAESTNLITTNDSLSALPLNMSIPTANTGYGNGNRTNETDSFDVFSNSSTDRLPTASEEFFRYYVLDISSGIDNLGSLRWQLVLSLFIAWLIIFLSLIKGVKSSGKVVYFTATFPYLMLTILLIRGSMLPGAWRGIKFYITPQWDKLLTFKVWIDAATQIFYSVGPGWGGLITMSSYNKFHNNCYRDGLIIPVLNCVTSVFAGFVVFSVLGFMSQETGLPVEKVAQQGAGLAFVTYPEALTKMPVSPVWAVMFFFMLITLGLDSQFVFCETIITSICDEFPRQLYGKKSWVTAVTCITMFALGLCCVCQGGMYILQLLDGYVALVGVLIIVTMELLVVGWVYGANTLLSDVEFMIQKKIKTKLWWSICWKFLGPIVILLLLIMTLINHVPMTYGDYTYPPWAIYVGWGVALSSAVPIPIYMLYFILTKTSRTGFSQIFSTQFWRQYARPTSDWHPHRDGDNIEYMKMVIGQDGFRIQSQPLESMKYSDHLMKD